MKLKISNFARIKKTEIEIDGITVIAGYNNTGKSTIGKIIFSLFNSLNNIEDKIDKLRRSEIENVCLKSTRNYIVHSINIEKNINNINSRMFSSKLATDLANDILNLNDEFLNNEEISKIINEVFKKNDIMINQNNIFELIEIISNKVVSLTNQPNSSIICEIISRYFDRVFSGQVNCLHKEKHDAKLELIIKNKNIITTFENNKCVNYEPAYNILHEAFYIDNPFIIDDLSSFSYYDYEDANPVKSHILSKLSNNNNNIMDGIFDAVIAKEKLEDIYKVLNEVIDGNIVVDSGTFGLDTMNFSEPIKLKNLSTGLKSFVIIKMLLENGKLKEKDVLILDEPEIHLHPEWQLIYAEIIVLLQKAFDLSIVVTTHSSNFLESIDYFSKKYLLDTKCKYYLATSVNGISTFENVTDNLDKIYAQMIQPSVLLDKLKYEMENTENE